ncbi:carboxypeptidase regulatory-like domain-containing protein [Paenibacillus psychroresistens]|nr:carboxypeptidase regulatory-like domain-containing protein [Paenibacillus psychroresistens]
MLKNTLKTLNTKLLLILLLLTISMPQMTVFATDGIIHGKVTDTNAHPIQGIQLEIKNSSHTTVATLITNSDGDYYVGSLDNGIFYVDFSDSKGFYGNQSTTISVTGNYTLNQTLAPSLAISTYYDTNYNAGLFSGSLSWTYTGNVTVSYNVYYLANDNTVLAPPTSVTGVTYAISNVPQGAKRIGIQVIAPNGELGPIISTPLWDAGAYNPQNFSLYDTNPAPDVYELKLTWSHPIDESQFNRYVINYKDKDYNIIGTEVELTSQVSSYIHTPSLNITSAVYSVQVNLETSNNEMAPFSFNMLVSDLTTGKAAATPASNLSLKAPTSFHFYNDTDPASHSIGGALDWTEAGITGYEMYLLDDNDIKLSSVLTLAKQPGYTGNYWVSLPNGTSLTVNGATASKLGVYPKDINGSEGLPIIINIVDVVGGIPQSVFFYDTDQVTNHVTGTLSWYSAINESAITGYKVYFADEDNNLILPAITSITKAASSQSYTLAIDQTIPLTSTGIPATRIAVVSVNGATIDQQVTKAIWDNSSINTGNITFQDRDSRAGKIVASITWGKSSNEALFEDYVVFYYDSGIPHVIGSVSKSGIATYTFNLTETLYNNLPANQNVLQLGIRNTKGEIAPISQVIAIVDNTLTNPSLPTATTNIPAVNGLIFLDSDTLPGKIGGSLAITDSSPYNGFDSYMVYFVNDAGVRIQSIAQISKTYNSTIQMTIPVNTLIPNGASAIGVFAKNASGESSNGTFALIWDSPRPIISNPYFEDTDLRAGLVTPILHWDRLADETHVSKYVVYFIDSNNNRQILTKTDKTAGSGAYSFPIPSDVYTNIMNYDARSILIGIEDTSGNVIYLPAYFNQVYDNTQSKTIPQLSPPLVDTLPVVNNVTFNYNAQNTANELNWHYPENSSNIEGYELYFLDKMGQKLGSILTLKKSYYGESSVFLPSTLVYPTNASKIGIFAKTVNGEESRQYTAIPLFHLVRAAIDPLAEGVGINKIISFISGNGGFQKQDIEDLLGLIDLITNPEE